MPASGKTRVAVLHRARQPGRWPGRRGFGRGDGEARRPTWFGKCWELGGGGTVWDSIVYDPELDQLLIGIGNGARGTTVPARPARATTCSCPRSSRSIPTPAHTSGTTRTIPSETWDFTATQQIMLADLTIDGKARKVLMQAPKNGFFYVIDRTTGKLISAEAYAPQNWAERIDLDDRPPGRAARGALCRGAAPVVSLGHRRACVDADELFAADRPRLHPGDARAAELRGRRQLHPPHRALEHRS